MLPRCESRSAFQLKGLKTALQMERALPLPRGRQVRPHPVHGQTEVKRGEVAWTHSKSGRSSTGAGVLLPSAVIHQIILLLLLSFISASFANASEGTRVRTTDGSLGLSQGREPLRGIPRPIPALLRPVPSALWSHANDSQSYILELKAASAEIHRNGDVFPEEKHVHLRNGQKRQRCPLTQGHL